MALSALVSALAALLSAHRAGSLAVQAFVVEWGAGRLGVAWSDPEAPPPNGRQIAARLGKGVLFGAALGLFVLGFARLTGAATFTAWTFAPSGLAVGAAVAIFSAVRDELLLRGLVLRTFRHSLGGPASPVRLAVCGAVAAAARVGQLGDEPLVAVFSLSGLIALASAALGGVCFATLWLRDRGAWMAFGAHTAWALLTTTVISGGVCDARWRSGGWGGGGGLEGSGAAAVGLAAIATVATYAWYRAVANTR